MLREGGGGGGGNLKFGGKEIEMKDIVNFLRCSTSLVEHTL